MIAFLLPKQKAAGDNWHWQRTVRVLYSQQLDMSQQGARALLVAVCMLLHFPATVILL